jgi:hypothetical protein
MKTYEVGAIQQWITLLNEGSDNKEYLRGQIELAMALLGYTYDDEKLVNELIRGVTTNVQN